MVAVINWHRTSPYAGCGVTWNCSGPLWTSRYVTSCWSISASKNCLFYFCIRRCCGIYTPERQKVPNNYSLSINRGILHTWETAKNITFIQYWTDVCSAGLQWNSRVVRHFTCKKCLIDQAFQVTSHLLEKCQKGAICCDSIAQTTVCNQTIAAKRWILFRWIYMYILFQFLVSVIILIISRT